jgi:poly(A) polymerase
VLPSNGKAKAFPFCFCYTRQSFTTDITINKKLYSEKTMLKRLLNLLSPTNKNNSRVNPSPSSSSESANKSRTSLKELTPSAKIIPRDQHCVSRKNISPAAIKIIKQLEASGFSAYLVGGSVRDLLLGNHPKDFDVATDAKPEEVSRLFRGARIIGRRFQIVHVRIGREVIEVTTFRGHHQETHEQALNEDGMLLHDNVYGDLASDAMRRDFTVNALYYSLNDFSVIDFCGGIEDLAQRQLKMIGDPITRYKEDPVRLLRVIRFAAKLGFSIEPNTAAPIRSLGNLLLPVSNARLFDEVLKLFLGGSATATFTLLHDYEILEHLFPGVDAVLKTGDPLAAALIEHCMINTDKRVRSGKTVTPAFIYAALLWPVLQATIAKIDDKITYTQAVFAAGTQIINQQLSRTAIPKRFLIPMREIWDLQQRLTNRSGMRAFRTLEHPRFRAAYDFLLMREAAGEQLQGIGNWWAEFQMADENARELMVKELQKQDVHNRKRR